MRFTAGCELLVNGRAIRVRLTRRWRLGAIWFARSLWVAIGPLRVVAHTGRVYWEQP